MNYEQISSQQRYALGAPLSLPLAVLTASAIVLTALGWTRHDRTLASKAWYTVLTVGAAAFVWFLDYWNLPGWRV